MAEKKPIVWERFNWIQIEKDGEVTIGPYESFKSHVECPRCGKNTDYHLWKHWGCVHCGHSEPLEEEIKQ